MIKTVEDLPFSEASEQFINALGERVLVLDGGLGTMIQQLGLTEDDFHGGCDCGHCGHHDESAPKRRGCNDILTLTRPDVIESIHRQYLEAGADIIETDSFNANAISLADYGLSGRVAEINHAAAAVARRAADSHSAATGRQVWVAGSVGPSGKSLTMAASLGENVDWNKMVESYYDQTLALIEGGVDILLIETVFDVLNAKAAIFAARRAMLETGRRVPLIFSMTLTESGRTLSGMTPQAAVTAVSHALPVAVGMNCGFGADDMIRHISSIKDADAAIIMYPNAGLPNELGQYEESPEKMASTLQAVLSKQMVNIVGGCCGTTPAHIARIAEIARDAKPRPIPSRNRQTLELSGLDNLRFDSKEFINVGERCNVAGSRKFLRLIKEDNIDEALTVAAGQVEKGADIIDINMDDGMLDAPECMARFLTRIATEPSIARVPLMIDSSDFELIRRALTLIQGKPIVNSISLKEGEEKFLERARAIHELGATMVVMAFDEDGQATSYERRTAICRRAYSLLTEKAGIPPCDIIFDPNILAVATGLPEHDNYGKDFIESAGWIMENLPGVNVSGGLSNLSFSFRGNDYVRNAMHSIFISKARSRGMKMAIVNPSGIIPIENIPEHLTKAISDVLDNTDAGATERLITVAQEFIVAKKPAQAPQADPSQKAPVKVRLAEAIVNGSTANLAEMLDEALKEEGSAVKVIDSILMEGMNTVGDRFGRGEMFLPQVVKSATVMKQAVDILTPVIEQEKKSDTSAETSSAYRMVIATVKGDVHDIGKNIVDVVMTCNGFSMTDLGVMTPAEKIVDTAITENADCIGLSGLITPSLAEMVDVARTMERRGLKIPLFVGGATTSQLHTAVKIAPEYSGPVIHTRDAASLATEAKVYLNPATSAQAAERLRQEQQAMRDGYVAAKTVSVEQSRNRHPELSLDFPLPELTRGTSTIEIPVSEVVPLINYRQFLASWGLDPNSATAAEALPQIAPSASESEKLMADARQLIDSLIADNVTLTARMAVTDAYATDDDCLVLNNGLTIPMLRQSRPAADGKPMMALTDYFPRKDSGKKLPVAMFAVTVTGTLHRRLVKDQKSYDGLLADFVLNRLVEAATALLHKHLVKGVDYEGIRPAIGYPSMPDQLLVHLFDRVLDYEGIDVTVTDNGALFPSSTTTGLVIIHPQARYFSVLPVGKEQRADYATRRGLTLEQISAVIPD